MKIQGLAIIFILIILPITLVIGEYANVQKETIELELLYDSRLITATHDALKAFQINTFNDAASDIADSKISSIEASVNAFYNSMGSSFGMQGYSQKDLQSYVPALVYTMYDGYYIYSPYTNVADISSGTELNIDLNSDNIQYGFKPYVYYSCRYTMGLNSDFVINYSLDNYITVQGTINGEPVNGTGIYAGYLLTIANSKGDPGVYYDSINNRYYYNGVEILPETSLRDYLVEEDGITKQYKYIKLNGTKYYWDEAQEYIFYILGGNRIKQVDKASNEEVYNEYVKQIENNTSAINYYKHAYEFSSWVQNNLNNLKVSNAIGNIQDTGTGDGKIFKNKNIEYPSSNFNLHRKEVIRYSIESNLSVAIANFNNYTSSGTNFQMPKLKETEWEMLQNEVSIISFLQGLNIGGKVYNGYTVVTNDKTEEFVSEENIYITDGEYYHRINDECLLDEDIVGNIVERDSEIEIPVENPIKIVTASEITADDYGGYVVNYSALVASNADLGIGGWRIFHSDGSNIYLIADNYIDLSYVPKGKRGTSVTKSTSYSKAFNITPYQDYTGIADISSDIKTKWLSKYTYTSTVANIKATAYLLDTNVWSGFRDNKYANYAIGAPTIELFVASYNVTHTDRIIDTQVSDETGYHVKWNTGTNYGSSLNGLNKSESLYVIGSNANAAYMWLASGAAQVRLY